MSTLRVAGHLERCRHLTLFGGVLVALGCAGLGEEESRAPKIGTLYGDGDPDPPPLTCEYGVGESGCAPPQLLIVLDRSTSMAALPDGARPTVEEALTESKWARAIDAIVTVANSDVGQRVSFGLEIFPRDPGEMDYCVAIERIVDGPPKYSLGCREGSLLVAPCPAAGPSIREALDVTTTTLCGDTPIGAALDTASEVLTEMRDPFREQYVLLVTDGADTCSRTAPALVTAEQLAADGVGLFAVGFAGGNVDPNELTLLACAGGTAPDPEHQCAVDAEGDSLSPDGYLVVEDGAALEAIIRDIAGQIQCAEIY